MTTYKSDAVTAGLMPDYSRAGVVLCRTGEHLITVDLATSDVVQMVPVPKGAQILNVQVFNDTAGGKLEMFSFDVGDAGDVDRFFDGVSFGYHDTGSALTMSRVLDMGHIHGCLVGKAGFLYTYTGNDTIDILVTANSTATGGNSGWTVGMNVFYKMAGSIADEDF